jgi:hypothetical protein
VLVAAVGSVSSTILVLPLLVSVEGRSQAGLNTPAMAFIVALLRFRFTYPPLLSIAWSNNCQLLVGKVISPKSKPAPISRSMRSLVVAPAVLAVRAVITSAIVLRPLPPPAFTVILKVAVCGGLPYVIVTVCVPGLEESKPVTAWSKTL